MALKQYLPQVTGRQAARYVFLPEILPRIRSLGGSGFHYLAFLIASIYRMVRILPEGHPYTLAGNIGTFGLRAVVSEAANHVKLDSKHIDQVIIYFAILAAIIILFLQFIGLVLLIFSGQAFASSIGSPDDYSFFRTEYPQKDVAFLLLDHVFGVPEFFGSEAPTGTPFHVALHTMLQFYNMAILVVAVLIFLYYVIVVIAETAQSGTPFGQRFNSIYAPIRLVVALGLLVPLNHGLNTAQYITLFSAKIGSSFATNGWLRFNDSLENPLGAEKNQLIAEPVVPDVHNLVATFALIHTCKNAYESYQSGTIDKIDGYIIKGGNALSVSSGSTDEETGNAMAMGYNDARDNSNGNSIRIVYGHYKEDGYPDSPGNVFPYCGSVTLPITTQTEEIGGQESALSQVPFVYWYLIRAMWEDPELKEMAQNITDSMYPDGARQGNPRPDAAKVAAIADKHRKNLETQIKNIIKKARNETDFALSEDIKRRGWGGAGIWYNSLAEVNGALQAAVYNIPARSSFPSVLDTILEKKRSTSAGMSQCSMFEPNLPDGTPMVFDNPGFDRAYANALDMSYRAWECDTNEVSTTNVLWDAMHMIFGIQGLFDMRCNNKAEVNPLVQLTSIGKGLIDSSIRNLATAMGAAAFGGALKIFGQYGGDLNAMGQAASGFFLSFATIGLSIGFLLFYILPFMPFMYFFFAVGAWVKGIFEAMVGAPLWALAHLKIEGEGLPGKSAMNGYFLIFEIFLRPILIVAGLIGGMIIFSASVAILNNIFDTAVQRLTGLDINAQNVCTTDLQAPPSETAAASNSTDVLDKHIMDEFFFTVIYAIFVYMIATSCFKMIDLVPNQILRFMGGGVTPFADEVQDPAENLGQYAAIGGATIGEKVMSGVTQASQAGGMAIGGIGDVARRMGNSGQRNSGEGGQ